MTAFAFGMLDGDGLIGRDREPLPLDACVDARGRLSWKRCFETPHPDFRRLDLRSRAITLAAEAIGLDSLAEEDRADTAVVVATTHGCLDADLGFARSLNADVAVASGLFPHTLPSTCTSALAIRHGLQGPTLALCTRPREELTAFEVIEDLLAEREASYAIAVLGDVVSDRGESVGVSKALRILTVLLDRASLDSLRTLVDTESADPLGALMIRLRNRGPR